MIFLLPLWISTVALSTGAGLFMLPSWLQLLIGLLLGFVTSGVTGALFFIVPYTADTHWKWLLIGLLLGVLIVALSTIVTSLFLID